MYVWVYVCVGAGVCACVYIYIYTGVYVCGCVWVCVYIVRVADYGGVTLCY